MTPPQKKKRRVGERGNLSKMRIRYWWFALSWFQRRPASFRARDYAGISQIQCHAFLAFDLRAWILCHAFLAFDPRVFVQGAMQGIAMKVGLMFSVSRFTGCSLLANSLLDARWGRCTLRSLCSELTGHNGPLYIFSRSLSSVVSLLVGVVFSVWCCVLFGFVRQLASHPCFSYSCR